MGKLYGRVLTKRAWARTEFAIEEEQCGFRQGRGCMGQVFAVRQVCEKYIAYGKDEFWAFIHLEKAYDMIDLRAWYAWLKLTVYGVADYLCR